MSQLDEMLERIHAELRKDQAAGKRMAPIDGALIAMLTGLTEVRDEIRELKSSLDKT